MSGSIEKLTAALEANTAVHEKVLAALKGGGAAAASGKPASEAPKGASKPAAGKDKKKKTVEDIAAAFGGYLGVKDADERTTRKGHVKAIVDYFGVAKATEIDPDNFEEALRYLQQYIDGETPDFDGAGDGDGDEALV